MFSVSSPVESELTRVEKIPLNAGIKNPSNGKIIPRHLLFHLEPNLIEIAEIIPKTVGIEQLRNDVDRKFVNFNGVLPPLEFVDLPIEKFRKQMKMFLYSIGFSKKNINLIFQYYSQKPANAVNFGQTLLSLKYNKKNYPKTENIFCAPASEYTNNIFEKNEKVYFETSASQFPIRTNDGLMETINDEIQSLFELTVNGFKLEHFKTFNLFTELIDSFLNGIMFTEGRQAKQEISLKQEINHWIFMYCLAANANNQIDYLSRQEMQNKNFKNIINASLDPKSDRKVICALYESGIYFQKKYEFGGGKHCGYQQLINHLTNYYKNNLYAVLAKFNDQLKPLYHPQSDKNDQVIKKLLTLKLHPSDISELIKKGEIITFIPKDERKYFSQSALDLLDGLYSFSSKLLYLKNISIKRKNTSSNFSIFKKTSTTLDDLSWLLNKDSSTKTLGLKS